MVGPVEDRHTGEPPRRERRPHRLGQDLAVDDARDRGGWEEGDQVVDRHPTKARRGLIRAPDGGREALAERLGGGEGQLRHREGPALHDRPLEEPSGAARDHVGEDGQATGRLARDGHPLRVAAEPRDVLLHPAQRGLLIHQPVVAGRPSGRRRQRRMRQEAKGAEPVVDRDDNGAIRGQLGGVEVARGILRQAAAVDPHEHGSGRAAPERRRGHVEVEAVLCDQARREEQVRRLRTAGGERGRVAHPAPVGRRPGGPPPETPGGWGGVGEPAERVAAGHGDAADGTAVDRDDRARAGVG